MPWVVLVEVHAQVSMNHILVLSLMCIDASIILWCFFLLLGLQGWRWFFWDASKVLSPLFFCEPFCKGVCCWWCTCNIAVTLNKSSIPGYN